MHSRALAAASFGAAAFILQGGHATAQGISPTSSRFFAILTGFEEIGGQREDETGPIFSPAVGRLTMDLNRRTNTITFRLSYLGFTSPVTQAHIHFAKSRVAGGIMVFFCSNLPSPPPGTQPCPSTGGTVNGTITSGSVIGPSAQNVNPGDFNALVAALVTNTTYANIHSTNFPQGEIRGQIGRGLHQSAD